MAHSVGDSSLPIPEDIVRFSKHIGYPVESTKSQRILGPISGQSAPPHGTEVFISNLPKYLMEDYLFPYFQQTGTIYKFRLMLTNSEYSRGSAYITYDTIEIANESVRYFNGREVFLGQKIFAEKSKDNRRLFLGGIPDNKSRDDVWHQLQKLGVRGIVDVIMYRSYSDKNRNRGFVFVEFKTHQEAAQARFTFKDCIIFGQRVSIDWSSPINDVTDDVMSKVKILFLRNLNVCQERDEFVTFLRTTLLGLNTVEKIYKFRDYAFVHFKTRRDAQKAMWELKSYYKNCNSDVEIEWAKPAPVNVRKQPSRSNKQEYTSTPMTCNCQCRHSYVPSPENPSPIDSSGHSSQDSPLRNDLTSGLMSTPARRIPFQHLRNDNQLNSNSEFPSPLFGSSSPPSLLNDLNSGFMSTSARRAPFQHLTNDNDLNINSEIPSSLFGSSSPQSLLNDYNPYASFGQDVELSHIFKN